MNGFKYSILVFILIISDALVAAEPRNVDRAVRELIKKFERNPN